MDEIYEEYKKRYDEYMKEYEIRQEYIRSNPLLVDDSIGEEYLRKANHYRHLAKVVPIK